MEALCCTRSVEPLESIITCLQALYTLFDSQWARNLIMVDKSLGIELCNVLHRLLLTRDNQSTQLLCMEVLKKVIQAAQEDLDTLKKNKLQETTDGCTLDVDLLGEGAESGTIVPYESLVFAVLEVCLCLIVRQLPVLSPSPNSAIITTLRATQPVEDSNRLIAAALSCMENLHKLCSPKGALSIIPTVLYLTTGVIKEMATKNVNDSTILANSASVQGALHCLRVLATDRYSNDSRCEEDWQKLLQSALAKVIDLAKTSVENKLDEVTMMLAIGVFVLNAPAKVVTAPNLQYPCINHFRQCLQSSNSNVSGNVRAIAITS